MKTVCNWFNKFKNKARDNYITINDDFDFICEACKMMKIKKYKVI